MMISLVLSYFDLTVYENNHTSQPVGHGIEKRQRYTYHAVSACTVNVVKNTSLFRNVYFRVLSH